MLIRRHDEHVSRTVLKPPASVADDRVVRFPPRTRLRDEHVRVDRNYLARGFI